MENQAAAQAQTSVEEVKNLEQLSPSEQQRVDEIAKSINVTDSQGVIQYGVGTQSKISEFSDSVLKEIKTKDAGENGEILTDLMLKIKDLDVESLSDSDGFLSKIPLISSLVSSSKKFLAKYDTISVQIEKIIDELHKARQQLLKDITLLDGMYAKNLDYYKELNLHILAGEQKLKELMEVELPALKAKSEASKDPADGQKYQDFVQMINRFEKKIHDLKLSKMLSLQMAPQIRLIQSSNQALVEKIQSSILNTIPLWKNQIVIAISLLRQKKALEVQKDVTKTTNDILAKNSEMLKTGSLEIAKEAERGIVELDTLKKINSDLIQTIEETLKIQSEGRQKRKTAEVELTKMETELKAKLMEVKK
ncbi:MAG TPA: toxic anion resistance protein [Leptospiraceae bacterium]|nr:toxic anion resistance protein [Leptospiraceae bacterium]HMY65050.1 toxic anion resistance protein [Leptospiraceae bacterium]HMZ57748.1 toxic anion resistance protein [Leptospiraceae bacterium]HNF13413.1 toxic anion resistance protein [Leptospiraceae bacterium]HNF23352.1 toxic anion resistance protein [Leptospiraceae bacterium]